MGIDISVQWDAGMPARVSAAAVQGLNAAAEQLLGSAKELSPVDSGDNRESGAVQEATHSDPVAWVTFNMPYSASIHEGTHMVFNRSKNPQAQAKYLEMPMIRDQQVLLQIVQAFVRRAL